MPTSPSRVFNWIRCNPILLGSVGACIALTIYAFAIKSNWIEFTHHTLQSNEDTRKIRVAQLSDLPGSGHWSEVNPTPKRSLILSALVLCEVLQIVLLLPMVSIANRENQSNKSADHTQLAT
jgi:hypothetical protein